MENKKMSSYQKAINRLAILEIEVKRAIEFLDEDGPMNNEERLEVLKWLIQAMQREQNL